MDSFKNRCDQAMVEYATTWYMEVSSPQVSDQIIANWQAWLLESELHQQAFEKVSEIMQLSSQIEGTLWPDSHELLNDNYDGNTSYLKWKAKSSNNRFSAGKWLQQLFNWESKPQRWAWSGAVLAGLALFVISTQTNFLSHLLPQKSSDFIYQTAVAEHLSIPLKDGSKLTLGGGSQVFVSYSEEKRLLRIDRGEAYFEVAKDKSRPFVVVVGDNQVRAIGTEFNINRQRANFVVTVTEGVVEVDVRDQAQPLLTLKEGQQLRYNKSKNDIQVNKVNLDIATSWLKGTLEYQGEPLSYVLQDINRYTSRNIDLITEPVSKLSFTGTVLLNSIDSWLIGLEKAFPVKVLETHTGYIVLSASQSY